MLSLEIVKHAIETGKICFVEKFDTTVCSIGDYWFYFMASEDSGMLPDEYRSSYTLDEQSEQIFDVLSHWKEYGLGDLEVEYYNAYLEEEHGATEIEPEIKNTYEKILEALPHHPDDKPSNDWHCFWVSGADEIMCPSEEAANTMADFFEDCGVGIMHTFHYDDEERDGLNYGWWAVYVDGQ